MPTDLQKPPVSKGRDSNKIARNLVLINGTLIPILQISILFKLQSDSKSRFIEET